MFEKTLWEISEIEDTLVYEQEMIKIYYDCGKALIADKNNSSADYSAEFIIPLWAEMLPSDPAKLKKIIARLDKILDFKTKGYTEERGASAFTQLHSAASFKLSSLEKKSDTMYETIKKNEANIATQEAIIAANLQNNITDNSRPNERIRVSRSEIKILLKALSLGKGVYDKATGQPIFRRLTTLIESLNHLTPFVPEDIRLDMIKQFRALSHQLPIIAKINPDNQEEYRSALEGLKSETYKAVMLLAGNAKLQLHKIKDNISQNTFTEIDNQIKGFGNFSAILNADVDQHDVYELIVDKFALMYTDLAKAIKHAPTSPKEEKHRNIEEKATQFAEKDINTDEYPYQMSGADLRQSQNESYIFVLEKNYVEIANKNKFLVRGIKNDNLFQIKHDIGRSLRINGIDLRGKIFENDAALKAFLIEQLGPEHTANLILHYDQTLPILISGAINKSGGANIMGGIEFNPMGKTDEKGETISHTENVYVKDGVLYRDAVVENFRVYVPEDQHMGDNERWIYKTNIKLLSTLSADGFEVVKVGTDNAFISNSILQKSTHIDLKTLLTKVLEFENYILSKKEEFSQKGEKTQKKFELTEKTLTAIQEFKTGKLTLGKFKDQIHELSLKDIPHVGNLGKAKGLLLRTKPGIITTLENFDSTLELIVKKINAQAEKYKVGTANSPKNLSASPSLSRSRS